MAAAGTLEQLLPRTIHKAPLSLPGATPASRALVEELLERDRATHHCFFNAIGFHNHLSHHLLAAYDLGASPALLQAAYDEELKEQNDVFVADREKGTVERQKEVLTRENWREYLGQDKYYANYVLFFSEEVKRLGAHAAFEEYVFSEQANAHGACMTERFVAGALHPFIQMGYAIEFNSPAMVAQGPSVRPA
ncbi:hypothetical protein K488DRAFT_86285 [Vararia minispora EC-137]|uniref:Uncharacterized protein n=1 Tax=Vararia minispora EC-137 TaxID=1314806 RepID=A0ACB8QJJ9_9AGAM|nr:hypothetical protein K488DRAFT_86285 [Vararia minispora EC-137]